MLERVLFFLPLCLVVSLVYAATKSDDTRTVIHDALHLFLMTVGSLGGLALVLYLICRFLQPSTWF